jgi:hypothetical protein
MTYKAAKLNPNTAAHLRSRIGLHAMPWNGLIGWDGKTAIAPDGSRRSDFKASDVVLASSVEDASTKTATLVDVTFPDKTGIKTYKPYWL